MKRLAWALALASLSAGAAGPVRIAAETFVTLPAGVRHPEGLASNPENGDLYVGTFDTRGGNQVLRYAADGRLLGRRDFGATPLTGLAFAHGQLYVLNFGAAKLQRLDAELRRVEDLASFAAPAVNGMVFDSDGTLYVSESFEGAVYRIERASTCSPCTVAAVSRDPLLRTAGGALPFGANGLAFGTRPGVLYVANAGANRLLRLELASGRVSVLAESLPGADGLMFHGGLLWLAANQADVVLGIDEDGLTRVRAGEFAGVRADGSPEGLLFPASTAVSGAWMVVTNLALPITPATGDEWEERVTRWNLARFKLP